MRYCHAMKKMVSPLLVVAIATQISSCHIAMARSLFSEETTFEGHSLAVKVNMGDFSRYPKWSGTNPPMQVQDAVKLSKKALATSRWSQIPTQIHEVKLQNIQSTQASLVPPQSIQKYDLWVYVVYFHEVGKESEGLLPVIILFDGSVLLPEVSE
jgi:hypothetical protein